MELGLSLSISDIDFNNAGSWPWPGKLVAILLVFAAVLGAWYYYMTRPQLEELERLEQQEVKLKKDFAVKQEKAANLEAYQQQLLEMEETFGAMLNLLPNQTQIAELLVDVSQTGLATGLEFELFQPESEVRRDFYAELPINIKVIGHYHEFANFVSGLASLPRIVTVHDVVISPQGRAAAGPGDDVLLSMTAVAKTYRYLDEGKK